MGIVPQTALPVTVLLFLIAGAAVWFSGTRLVVYADEIADRLRIGRALMGFVFLAAAMYLLAEERRLTLIVPLAAGISLAGYFIFTVAFETRFPRGPFETFMQGVI